MHVKIPLTILFFISTVGDKNLRQKDNKDVSLYGKTKGNSDIKIRAYTQYLVHHLIPAQYSM